MFIFLFGFPLLSLTGGCTFDRPLLGEFYSYENGLETHTSLKENGVVDRRSYRRESGAGATRKDGGDLLVTQDLGHCYQLTVRQNYYELIYRDEDKSCFQCYQMFNRTKNVIQIRKSSCGETTSLSTNQMNFDDLLMNKVNLLHFSRKVTQRKFAKSLFAECSSLSSPTDGPEKVIITPIIPEEVNDPYNNFKCWVYERIDYDKIHLSRSAGSFCGYNQTSQSYEAQDGVDLAITLAEAERILKSQIGCTFDRPIMGEYYSYENGLESHTSFKENGDIDRLFYRRESGRGATANIITVLDNHALGECFRLIWRENPFDHISKNHFELIYRDKEKSCYQCYQIHNRTRNILQFRNSECNEITSISTNQMNFQDLCSSINQEADFDTLFSKTYSAEECRATIYGTYHFTYEFRQGGIGICDNPISRLVSCPDPGTPFEAVNERFWMTYGYCRDLVSSIDAQPLYQCLGYWINEKGDIFTAIANERVGSERWYDKFRCMLTRQDQPQWFAKSLFAECARLYSPTDGPEKVIITPIIPEVPTPTCFFPDNFTGEWVNTANVNARTIINATHIHEISQVNNRGWLRETYYVCQQISRQQFLVKTVTKGECFSYYICFDFKDRHHNILRYRKSKSFMSNVYDDLSKRDPLYEVCSWISFGNDANWKYQVFVLDPPAPIECPFTGMWMFKQVGQPNSLIQTRIRGGITPRPRDHGWYITCDPKYMVSQWTICGDQTKTMLADREYCRQLDPYGTPIGVYEQPDYIYQCAGYWREDSRSYLITYDRDDPYINFKCWVYERIDYDKIYLSRSAGSFCGFNQTSQSYEAQDGADLKIELEEAERIRKLTVL
ncbi:unnamed protein product [Rotaria socialis]|uniref:Uncharacterized protein n=1 Tax=Rotaria socialis TaxID=392032 RepID=A0A820BX07_9BILA|nr:unnamed protein product [Rotaria socialis]